MDPTVPILRLAPQLYLPDKLAQAAWPVCPQRPKLRLEFDTERTLDCSKSQRLVLVHCLTIFLYIFQYLFSFAFHCIFPLE